MTSFNRINIFFLRKITNDVIDLIVIHLSVREFTYFYGVNSATMFLKRLPDLIMVISNIF